MAMKSCPGQVKAVPTRTVKSPNRILQNHIVNYLLWGQWEGEYTNSTIVFLPNTKCRPSHPAPKSADFLMKKMEALCIDCNIPPPSPPVCTDGVLNIKLGKAGSSPPPPPKKLATQVSVMQPNRPLNPLSSCN